MCRANFKGINDMDIEYNNGKSGENICRLINKGFTHTIFKHLNFMKSVALNVNL